MSVVNGPCKGCTKRNVNHFSDPPFDCHDVCEDWKKYSDDKKARKEFLHSNSVADDYKIDRVKKYRKY